jgi:NAD(P)-dependent dehydrogenase (short-subunit alcohol dehydrogenase family)
MVMDLGLADKVALVTGSYRGTGAAIAKALAAEGTRILVHGFAEGESEAVVAEIRDAGGEAHPVSGDILTDEGAAAVARQADELTDGVDVLVNNYGAAERGRWEDRESDDWLKIYDRNVVSAVRMIRHFVEPMKARGWGRIIQLGTVGSTRPNARMPHYYASKGALATLTVSLAKELAGNAITVNTVSPGLTRTAEVEAHYRQMAKRKGWGEDWAEIEAGLMAEVMWNPLGRIARVEEVADLVVFLASTRAGFINGQNIRVDGGAVDIVS